MLRKKRRLRSWENFWYTEGYKHPKERKGCYIPSIHFSGGLAVSFREGTESTNLASSLHVSQQIFGRVTIRPSRIIPQRWYNKHTTTHVRMYISKLEFHTQDVKMSNETKLRDNSEESFSQSRNQKSLKNRLPKISTTSHWFRKLLWSNQPAFWCWVLPKLPKQWNFPVDVVKVKKTIPCIKTRIDSGYPLSSQGVGNCICVLFTNIHTLAASRGEHF